jgi:uncharacterized membrane protein
VAAGKHSPIVEAIQAAMLGTAAEVRVHLSRRWWEPNPLKRAQKIFQRHGMDRTDHRAGVLLYVNLRRRKFAVLGDTAIHEKLGQRYWEELVRKLRTDLRSTHSERAIALAVLHVGEALRAHFPAV